MKFQMTILRGLSVIFLVAFVPRAKAQEKSLDFKAVKHFQIALESALYGVYREDKIVMSFPGEAAFYIRSEYKPDAKEQDLAFGSLHNPYDGSERINFEPKDKQRRIRSVLHVGSRWAFLDSMSLTFVVWDDIQKAWQLPGDIILDTPRPARDSRGEPTRAETAAMRARLVKSLTKERGNPDLIAGVAAIPKTWKDQDGSQYVIWLRGGSESLMTLKCDQKTFRICEVQRACPVKGMSESDKQGVTSVTLDPASQSLLLLSRDKQLLRRLEGTSCGKLTAKDHRRIPKELANSQGIFVDTSNNLWMALRESEGATSASIFTWDKGSW